MTAAAKSLNRAVAARRPHELGVGKQKQMELAARPQRQLGALRPQIVSRLARTRADLVHRHAGNCTTGLRKNKMRRIKNAPRSAHCRSAPRPPSKLTLPAGAQPSIYWLSGSSRRDVRATIPRRAKHGAGFPDWKYRRTPSAAASTTDPATSPGPIALPRSRSYRRRRKSP